MRCVLLLWLLCAWLVEGAAPPYDKNICTPGAESPGPLSQKYPAMPLDFQAVIELNDKVRRETIIVEEYFDYTNQRGVLVQIEKGQSGILYYFYKSNQIVYIGNDQTCIANKLSENTQKWVFGYKNGQMYSPAKALKMYGNGIVPVYKGKDTKRGITVDRWYSCQYWALERATINVDWYFADAVWQNPYGKPQYHAPVLMTVRGNANNGTAVRIVDHEYGFYNYRPSILKNTQTWEFPDGLVCLGVKNTKAMPKFPKTFSVTVEATDLNYKTISYTREKFDRILHIYQSRSRSVAMDHTMDEIHDFYGGDSYLIDRSTGQCTRSNISIFSEDVKILAHRDLRMRTAREFLDLDTKANYTYNGVHTVRGMKAMQWVTYRLDFPSFEKNPGESTWRFYVATDGSKDPKALPIPVRVEVDMERLPAYQYDMYQWDASQPDVFAIDMSPCFVFENRALLSFSLPQTAATLRVLSPTQFKSAVLFNIWTAAAINPLRFANYQAQPNPDGSLQIMVELSQLVGSSKSNLYKNTKLSDLTKFFIKLINDGKLVLDLSIGNKAITVVAIKGSAKVLDYNQNAPNNYNQPTLYGPGAMGGLAVGMIILGCLIGAGIAYIFFK